MLLRIDQLKNIGRFTAFRQRADALGCLALIFARNGFGKTTLCAVLRSASAQNSAPIDERIHLGRTGPPEASLTFDPAGAVVFQHGAWNRAPPTILLFDGEFVRRNVHAADEVTRDNKRQLLRVIIGAAGVRLAESVTEADAKINKLNAELKDIERAIHTAHPVITDYAGFTNAEVPAEIQANIDAAKRRVTAAQRASDIRTRMNIGIWQQLPNLEAIVALTAEDLEGASAAVEQRIDAHIAKHRMDANGRRWLAYGAERAEDACPYCDQDLRPSAIATDFKLLFGAAYVGMIKGLEAQLAIVTSLREGQALSVHGVLSVNRTGLEFWSQVGELPSLDDIDSASLETCLEALGLLESLLKAKLSAPLTSRSLSHDQLGQVRNALQRLANYADQVLACNQAIQAVREAAGVQVSAAQMREFQEAVDKRLALQAKAQEPIKSLCESWKAKTAEKASLASIKTQAQEALTAHVKATASAYEDGINALLEAFGANFRLCQTKASYVGRDPNTDYCIDVNGHVLKVGESSQTPSPSFRTVLSAGDKSSLALALFITQVRARADLGDVIVVLDDPFSSQDAARQFETASQIRQIAALARQVVVLSHDPRFLHLIDKDRGALAVSHHQIVAESDWVANLKAWPLDDEMKADYVRRAERIRAYARTGQHLTGCSPAHLAGDLRIFVEEFLDLRFPGRFAPKTLLGAMVDEIEQAGPTDQLHAQAAVLRSLNEYSRQDHHRGTNPPDPTQLRAQCRKIVTIIGTY